SLALPNLGRYLATSGYAIVALAAVGLAVRGHAARAAATAAACVLAGGSVVSLAARDLASNPGNYPRSDAARFLTTFAQGEGLKYGYAAYWVAAPLSWASRMHVGAYPASTCGAPAGLCTDPWHETPSSDAARPATPPPP